MIDRLEQAAEDEPEEERSLRRVYCMSLTLSKNR